MELLDGRYEIRDLLGRGGMAEVHRAHDRLLDREVAVKVLLDPVVGEVDAARHRFAAEARLLAALDHPAIVTLLGAGTSGGRPYFVMELVDGGTLSHRLSGERLDPAVAASIGSHVADGLAHAHARGVVHRDVKPGNVLLGTDGRVRLADFGIARMLGEAAGVTGTGTTVGTVAYLAPEQVRGDRVTPAADVYALGLMLLEAITGTRAYPGTSTEAALARLHRSPTIPVSLPHGWPRLLAAMTATDPAERPTATEVASALRILARGGAVLAPLGTGTDTVTVEVPHTQSVPVAGRRPALSRYRIAAAAAVAVVASVAGGAALAPDAAVSDERPIAPVTSGGPSTEPTSPESIREVSHQPTGRPATSPPATDPPATDPATAGTAAPPDRRSSSSGSAEPQPRDRDVGKPKHRGRGHDRPDQVHQQPPGHATKTKGRGGRSHAAPGRR